MQLHIKKENIYAQEFFSVSINCCLLRIHCNDRNRDVRRTGVFAACWL